MTIASSMPRIIGKIALASWAVILVVALIIGGAWHYAVLPGPTVGELAAFPPPAATNQWRLIHILSAECGCSASVAKYLANRRVDADASEEVWMLGESGTLAAQLSRAGFQLTAASAEALEKEFKIAGAPWLLVVNPGGRIVYSGGYARQNPATVGHLEDLALLRQLRAGAQPPPLPAFGCGVSRRVQQSLDPLGLKYSAQLPTEEP